jgi:hypothetical protein
MAMAMVAARGCRDQVALAQPVLPDDMRRDPGVGRIGEVAVLGPPNEPAVAGRIEPADGFAVGDDRRRRGLDLVGTAPAAAAMTTVTTPVAIVLVVALVAVKVLSTAPAVMLLVPMVRWRLRGSRRRAGVTFCGRRRCGRAFGWRRVSHRFAIRWRCLRRRRRVSARTLRGINAGRRLRRITFVGAEVRTGFCVWICGWPSGTRTAAPATGAATFVHVVERVLVDVCNCALVRRTCCGAPHVVRATRPCACTRAHGARRIGYCVERERACLFARRFRSRRVARNPHAIPATFFLIQRWPGVSRRSRRGATHPSLARSAQPTGRRPLYEYRTESAFAQA